MNSFRVAACFVFALLMAGCVTTKERNQGWQILKWIDESAKNGVSTKAPPELQTQFIKIASYDHQISKEFESMRALLREGDLIAYDMTGAESTEAIIQGKLNTIGYQILDYGHLAILVRHNKSNVLSLLSSQSFVGPNVRETVDSLKEHSFDVYRLDKWDQLDHDRFHEFVDLSQKKAWGKLGYDFSGMFGLWNSNLEPTSPNHIGNDYICSTVVVAALHYSGVRLDAIQRRGILDLVSPKQVVSSPGYLMDRSQTNKQKIIGSSELNK